MPIPSPPPPKGPPNTPNIQSSRALATSPVDLDRKIKHELAHSAFIDIPNLIESVFSGKDIDNAVSQIYNDLVNNGIYIKPSRKDGGHWRSLPQKPASESAIYEPLANILNSIAEQVRTPRMPIVWLDCHKKRMQSDFRDRLMPDLVSLCLPEGTNVREYLTTLQGLKDYEAWWRLVHTPLEVKKAGGYVRWILQTFKYGRQTLKEQPDRRFVFTFLYTKRDLIFWLLDRSGALGSQLFDVHQYPKKLIRIVVGLMLKEPSELGWDPTMRQYIVGEEGKVERKFSYEIPRTFKSKYHVAHERKWAVLMNKPKPKPKPKSHPAAHEGEPEPELTSMEAESTTETEEFILHRAVSLSHAEVIKGRSTRIWLAWLASNMATDEKERKVYVFKDCWRDSRRPHEGKLYEIGCTNDEGEAMNVGGVAEVYSYGAVSINGNEDSTKNLIRRGLPEPKSEPLMLYDWPVDDVESYWTEGHDAAEIDDMNPDVIRQHFGSTVLIKDAKPQNRVHSRLVLSSSGWPLFKFKSLLELFGALCDAVSGHKHLYRRGVLHRDLSPGNILITGLPAPNRGILIDLDYGIKLPRETEPLRDDELSGTIHFMSGELLADEPYFITPAATSTPTGPTPIAIQTAASDDIEVSLDDDEEDPPLKKAIVAEPGIQHAPHHDLEALFWTLCYLCIAREGPGAPRTTWPARNTVERGAILKTLSEYFYEENPKLIAKGKRELIVEEPTKFQSKIIDCFAPYFEPCKRFVDFLHKQLCQAYRTRDFSRLHHHFQNTFERATSYHRIQIWHSKNEEWQKMEEREEKRREEDKKGRFDSPHKINTKDLSTKGKRAREASPDPSLAEPAPSVSQQPRTKRNKRTSLDDSEPPSSPSARAASKTKSRSTNGQSSSATQSHNLRSKARTSSQNLATKDPRRKRKS